MGMILPPRRVSADSSGNGRSGAKLRIYNAGTTTLSSVYSDASLTTPLTNPVVANSSGVFPPIYAAEGALFDITEQTSGGSTIYSEDDVPATGATSGTLTRDFTTSRLAISGTAGVTSFEAGDAAGDDIGGKWRVGGWNGTQATTGELDAAATSVTGTLDVSGAATFDSTLDAVGLITENAKKLPGVVYTEASFSAVTTIDIPLTNIPVGVRGWMIEIIDLRATSTLDVRGRLAYDVGATFKTGAADYSYITTWVGGTSSTTIGRDDANDFMKLMTSFYTPGTASCGFARITVITPNSGNLATIVRAESHGYYDDTPDGPSIETAVGYGLGNYGRAYWLRLYSSTADTLTGRYRVVPLRGFGE